MLPTYIVQRDSIFLNLSSEIHRNDFLCAILIMKESIYFSLHSLVTTRFSSQNKSMMNQESLNHRYHTMNRSMSYCNSELFSSSFLRNSKLFGANISYAIDIGAQKADTMSLQSASLFSAIKACLGTISAR